MEKFTADRYNLKEEKLSKAWSDTLRALDNYVTRLLKSCTQQIFTDYLLGLIRYAENADRLLGYDIKIYDSYKNLMRYYYDTLNIYEETKYRFQDPTIKGIVEGICAVLQNELHQFEERQQNRFVTIDRLDINPIQIERQRVFADTKQKMGKACGHYRTKFLKETEQKLAVEISRFVLNLATDSDNRYSGSALEDLQFSFDQILSKFSKKLYGHFNQQAHACTATMNSLEERNQLQYYFDAIQQEGENLRQLIKIQVVALEQEMHAKKIDFEQEYTVQTILGKLRECYQYVGKDIDELIIDFKEAELKSEAKESGGSAAHHNMNNMPENEFMDLLMTCREKLTAEPLIVDRDQLINSFTLFGEQLQKVVTEMLTAYVQEVNAAKNAYTYKKMIIEKIMMTDEAIAHFNELPRYYEENKETLQAQAEENPFAIITGIDETMRIKIESLQESKEHFYQQSDSIIAKAGQDVFEIPEEIQTNTYNEALQNWLEAMYLAHFAGDEKVIRFLAGKVLSQVAESGALKECRDKAVKTKEKSFDSVQKKVTQYMKEQFLFEVISYEEIMNYSVGRLRETDNPEVVKYVTCADTITAEIMALLRKYNIETIHPSVGEIFNGREHEVIVAEKSDAFPKGQIIKVMNSGFKYGDMVLIRANVIAAR